MSDIGRLILCSAARLVATLRGPVGATEDCIIGAIHELGKMEGVQASGEVLLPKVRTKSSSPLRLQIRRSVVYDPRDEAKTCASV